ncbi:MAG: hypothetical protein K9M98_05475 [Cephaloticoccus sp.]|nr:hypothetical protein [Cephaloticoccus sp.]MCF7759934.1 hypothetical protein [Cephaloticoccus sp.]
MKKLYLLVFVGLASLGSAQSNPEDEIPIFNLDDYFVPPKMTMTVGARALTGSKVAFGGQGVVTSIQSIYDEFTTGEVRNYHDGTVYRDARTDNTPDDGKTNNWTYVDPRQLIDGDTNVAFHTYSAQVTDAMSRRNDPGLSLGTELVVARDMGNIGKKIEWKIFAGIGVNGIDSSARGNVAATITTITDTYGLNGQTLPGTVPYVAPSSTVDVDGNIVDTTVLLGRAPDSRTTTTASNDTQVSNYWKLKGTFLTLRMGPTVIYTISENLKLSISVGPTLVYSGTTYSVQQTLQADTSDPIVNTVTESEGKNLTGYYVDATLQYFLSESAGLYAGAFYQTSGDYTQTINDKGSSYTTDIDLSKLQGFRAGLNFKF